MTACSRCECLVPPHLYTPHLYIPTNPRRHIHPQKAQALRHSTHTRRRTLTHTHVHMHMHTCTKTHTQLQRQKTDGYKGHGLWCVRQEVRSGSEGPVLLARILEKSLKASSGVLHSLAHTIVVCHSHRPLECFIHWHKLHFGLCDAFSPPFKTR